MRYGTRRREKSEKCKVKSVEVIEPHGFCFGVKAAVETASRTVSNSASQAVYCLHELVHNEQVVAGLKARGLRFVESLAEVPDGSTVLFSAHGVAPAVREEAVSRALRVVDATCPFVERVHRAARTFSARGVPVVVVGRANHAELMHRSASCARRLCRLVPCMQCWMRCAPAIRALKHLRRRMYARLRATASGRWRISSAAAATECWCLAARAVRTRTGLLTWPARRVRSLQFAPDPLRKCARLISPAWLGLA